MKTKGNINAEVKAVARRLVSILALSVFADEGEGTVPPATPPANAPTATPSATGAPLNFEELIRAARQEEKDKLYGTINTLKEKNKILTESNNEALVKCAEWKQKYDQLNAQVNSGEKSQEVIDLEARIATLEAENAQLKENTPDEAAIRAQVEAEFTVKSHLEKVKESNKDNVLSVFMDEITGNTVEEIDQSLAKAIEKSNSVREQVTGQTPPPTNTATQTPPSNNGTPQTVPPATPPTANPNGSSVPPKFDPEYVRSLKPGTPEYDEFRKQMGLK